MNNDKVLNKLIEGDPAFASQHNDHDRHWEHIQLDLSAYKGQSVVIRLYDLILVPGHEAGNSYWRSLTIQ